jgi:hypothetical protein
LSVLVFYRNTGFSYLFYVWELLPRSPSSLFSLILLIFEKKYAYYRKIVLIIKLKRTRGQWRPLGPPIRTPLFICSSFKRLEKTPSPSNFFFIFLDGLWATENVVSILSFSEHRGSVSQWKSSSQICAHWQDSKTSAEWACDPYLMLLELGLASTRRIWAHACFQGKMLPAFSMCLWSAL